jgi:hypothetical protein
MTASSMRESLSASEINNLSTVTRNLVASYLWAEKTGKSDSLNEVKVPLDNGSKFGLHKRNSTRFRTRDPDSQAKVNFQPFCLPVRDRRHVL